MADKVNLDKKYQKEYFKGFAREHAGDVRSSFIKKRSQKFLGKKVLDVGAANGKLIELIPGAIGIDLSPRHPQVREGDITATDFEDESFDTIFALEVLEHFQDKTLEKALQEIHRILKTDGFFVVSTPHNEDLNEKMVLCPKCGDWFHARGHVRKFDEESMQEMLEDHGFFVEKAEVLPLGSFSRHPFLRNLWLIINFFNLGFKPTDLFVVARKR